MFPIIIIFITCRISPVFFSCFYFVTARGSARETSPPALTLALVQRRRGLTHAHARTRRALGAAAGSAALLHSPPPPPPVSRRKVCAQTTGASRAQTLCF